jgi:hypothetical protein
MSAMWADNPQALFFFWGYFAFCIFAVAITMWVRSFWLRLFVAELKVAGGTASSRSRHHLRARQQGVE